MTSVEMSNYSPTKAATKYVTLWDLLEDAAKRQYGTSIKVIKTSRATKQLNNLDFEVSVVSADAEPKESRRAIVDINMKEYTNRSDKEVDETLVKVRKRASKSTGSRYNFTVSKGVNWGVNGNIGAQVMGLAMVGGSASIGANYNKQKTTTTESETSQQDTFEFCYEQEEKIFVPPMSHVKAKITTYSMKYEQGYILKFSLPSSLRISVCYKTQCQQMFCGFNTRNITAAQFCSTLPDFREEDGKVSFIQPGTLSWVGEGSTIDKEVEPLLQKF